MAGIPVGGTAFRQFRSGDVKKVQPYKRTPAHVRPVQFWTTLLYSFGIKPLKNDNWFVVVVVSFSWCRFAALTSHAGQMLC